MSTPEFTRGTEYSLKLVPDASERRIRPNQARFEQIVENVITEGIPVVAIQPHRDDLVFSAGGLVKYLTQRGISVTSFTVMTEADDTVDSHFTRRVWNSDGAPTKYFATREEQDKAAITHLGVTKRHNVGLLDSMYRTREEADGIRVPLYEKIRGNRVPEDEHLKDEIITKLRSFIPQNRPAVVLGPLGVGGHIDHLLVRDSIVEAFNGDPTKISVFYQDIPYALKPEQLADPEVAEFIKKQQLGDAEFGENQEERVRTIYRYETEVPYSFPQGTVILPREVFYLRNDA